MSRTDFNGDGRDDVLWHRDDGALTDWLATEGGGFSPNAANELEIVNPAWQIAGTGDFNGGGRDDILWRRADGAMTNWLGNPNGSFTPNAANLLQVVDPQWHIISVGDFNGDGRDDILWRRTDGAMTDWLGNANGSFTSNAANALFVPDSQWHVVGTGDFNGDGRDDILWQSAYPQVNDHDGLISEWFGNAAGGFDPGQFVAKMYSSVIGTALTSTGIDDFNGDGRDDIIVSDAWGFYSLYEARPDGSFDLGEYAPFADSAQTGIEMTGDYNGDGRADLLMRAQFNSVVELLGQTDGSFATNPAVRFDFPTPWHIEPHWGVFA